LVQNLALELFAESLLDLSGIKVYEKGVVIFFGNHIFKILTIIENEVEP
jgi:hypothetical protein